jgi:xanthine dehydrogenase YagR molybdenum-binding subunit
LEVTVNTIPLGKDAQVIEQLRRGIPSTTGPEYPDFMAFSWIAHFAEVHVETSTGRVRVKRVVSVADCGRVMNRRTAESQVRGGVVWGIGAALREAGETDPRFGGVLNNDLAEYVVPVNADIGAIDVDFIDQPDFKLNMSGVKGLGEVAMVGAAAAIVNAVYNATGRRVRHLPIRIEDLL